MKLRPSIAAPLGLACIVGAVLALGGCSRHDDQQTAGSVPATAAGADEFVARINTELREKLPYLNSAQWLQATYITDDSQLVSSKANEEFLGYTAKNLEEAKKFNGVKDISADSA